MIIYIDNSWIDATGDVCIGDYIKFEKAIFEGGSFSGRFKKKARFIGTETITGLIIKDSYGKDKQQHTFTLQLYDNSKMLIKGRNIYRNGCQRLLWFDETLRNKSLEEKHIRGNKAREERIIRKQNF